MHNTSQLYVKVIVKCCLPDLIKSEQISYPQLFTTTPLQSSVYSIEGKVEFIETIYLVKQRYFSSNYWQIRQLHIL